MSPPYSLLKVLGNILFKCYFRLEIKGAENIPSNGPLIIAANHASFIDPLLIPLGIKRKVGFIITDKHYRKSFVKWVADSTYCIPVSDSMEGAGGMKAAMKYLNHGNALCIFPEGGRSLDGNLMEAKTGTGLLAVITGAIVIPAAIIGSFEAYPPHYYLPRPRKISVIFGKPLHFLGEHEGPRRAQGDKATKIIMEEVARLLREGSATEK